MEENYSHVLQKLEAEDNLRTLRTGAPEGKYIFYGGRRHLNLSSNDYLGVASRAELQREFLSSLDPGRYLMGNPSSRLVTGNSTEYDELESTISSLFPGRECLVFGSGYLANCAILPALTSPDDVILADRLVHASIIEGLRLSKCTWERFRHNDPEHLESLIRKHRSRGCGKIWVVTESVFSMDGDLAPIPELVKLKHRYDLGLYLDEAHAFGVLGKRGAGLAEASGLSGEIDLTVITLGKAAASQGGAAICSHQARQLLINRARGVIFSTALPPVSLAWSSFVVSRFPYMDEERSHLAALCALFAGDSLPRPSHIIPVMAHGNREAGELAQTMRQEGYWVTPIRYPTVAKGQARVRLSLTAAMEPGELEKLVTLCR
ncbi:MAG: 8-amino-7-oxononanoate synthase [Alistipes sp.]|nr:8-amino-7-oxononanoate synthase [Alistipes sp.]